MMTAEQFTKLRKTNTVDFNQPELICQLASTPSRLLCVHPDGAYKSRLVSTFETLFSRGLHDIEKQSIEKPCKSKPYPVVRINFTEFADFTSAEDFSKMFYSKLLAAFSAQGYQVPDTLEFPHLQLYVWMSQLDAGSLVVLIEEYDAPFANCRDNPVLRECVFRTLSEFFAVLKSCSGCLRFLFLTGCTQPFNAGFFEDLNYLTDI